MPLSLQCGTQISKCIADTHPMSVARCDPIDDFDGQCSAGDDSQIGWHSHVVVGFWGGALDGVQQFGGDGFGLQFEGLLAAGGERCEHRFVAFGVA